MVVKKSSVVEEKAQNERTVADYSELESPVAAAPVDVAAVA